MPRGEPTRSVPVRFTQRQRLQVEAAAERAGEALTVFVRRVALEASAAGPARVRVEPAVMTRAALATATRATATRMPVPVRPAHHPRCRCGVCRPPKAGKS